MEPRLQVTALTKRFRHVTALDRVDRSFQVTSLFPDLRVFENLRVAVQARRGTLAFWRNADDLGEINRRAERLLADIGLEARRDDAAGALSHGASNVNGTYLDDAAHAPLFEAAAGWQVPLFVHPTNPPGQERLQRYELEVVSGYLFDTTVNIFNMIFGGLLDRFPNVRLCCTHTGGYALLLAGRMQREVDTNPELARRIEHPVADYLRRLYYDTVCLDRSYLRCAAALVGADRLVLGSDHPFLLGEPDPVGFVRAAFPERELQDRVLRRNAADMLGCSTHERTPA